MIYYAKMSVVKPRTYLRTLLQTFSSPRYYLDVLNAPFSFSFRFYLLSYFCLTIIASLLFFTIDLPRYQHRIDQGLQELQASYPPSLTVTWTGKELQTNSPEPIEVKYPSFFQTSKQLPATFGFVLPQVNDPSQITSAISKSTWWVISRHAIYVPDGVGSWSEFPLQELLEPLQPLTITQQNLPEHLGQLKTFAQQSLTFFSFLYPVIWFIFFTITRFMMLFIYSFVIMFFLRIMNKNFPFMKIVQIALHVSIVSEAVLLFSHYAVPQAEAPMYLVTFWAYIIFIMSNLWNVKQIPKQHRR